MPTRKKTKTPPMLGDVSLAPFGDDETTTRDAAPIAAAVTPEMALVWSRCGTADRRMLLTQHRFTGLALGAGTPVDARRAADMLAAIAGLTESCWLTERMLSVSAISFTWYAPPMVRRMLWAVGSKTITQQVPYPGLILHVSNGAFSVFAYKGDGRPTPKTRLWNAPLANIYADGRMCFGNITPPRPVPASVCAYEDALFNTRSTTPNHDRTLTKIKDEPMALYRFYADLAAAKCSTFPESRLVPHEGTAGGLL
ncbi:MAG: hypothetical protein E6Q76_08250 [Rhizobium sp.]|nr:MAG: hypothetical protein E6Q76_08250 [Rhizobium sp.]